MSKSIKLKNIPQYTEIKNIVESILNSNLKATDPKGLYESLRKDPEDLYQNIRRTAENKEQVTREYVHDAMQRWNVKSTLYSFLNLAIGDKEASYYLASSFLEGFGVTRNEFLTFLFGAIGVKLKDQQSIELMEGETVPQSTLNLADKFIKVMKLHYAEVGDGAITVKEALARAMVLEQLIQKESGQSVFALLSQCSIEATLPNYIVEPLYPASYANDNHHEMRQKAEADYHSNAKHHNQSAYASNNPNYEAKEASEEGQPRGASAYNERLMFANLHNQQHPAYNPNYGDNSTEPSAPLPPSYAESQALASSYSRTKNDSPPSAHGAHNSASASASSSSSSSGYSAPKLNLASNYSHGGQILSAVDENTGQMKKMTLRWEVDKFSDGDRRGYVKTENDACLTNFREAQDYKFNYTKQDGAIVPLTCRLLYFKYSATLKDISVHLAFPIVKASGQDEETGPLSTAFQIGYSHGKLMHFSYPKGAIASATDKKAPVIINGPEIHTLPIRSDDFIDYKSKVIKNGGVVTELEIPGLNSVMMPHHHEVDVSGNCHGGCEIL